MKPKIDYRILILVLILVFLIVLIILGLISMERSFKDPLAEANRPPVGEQLVPEGETQPETDQKGEDTLPETNEDKETESLKTAEEDNQEIRSLLEKGQKQENYSYTALFESSANEFSYDYYKRENLTKLVTATEEGGQSITISDQISTVSYNLPEKTGFRMQGEADDMEMVPGIEALLQEQYVYATVGEEKISGLDCRVVETRDEFGVLKLWISKTLGLPIKYLGSYDTGWYSLTLSNIQTGQADESLFAIPSDILIVNE